VKITKRQLRRIIKEEVDSRLKNTHHDPRYQEGPPGGQEAYVASKETEAAERERERKHDQKTLEFINPTQKHIQKYLDQAQKLNLEVVENTPRLLLVQGLEDDLVEFDAYFNEMEDPQVANSFYKTASKKDIRQNVELAMKPVTEITKRQLRRIIRESLLREWQKGMDRDPSGQEVRDQVGVYHSTLDPDGDGWSDEAYDAGQAAGAAGLAVWLVRDPTQYGYLFGTGIWNGMAEYMRLDPEAVRAEVIQLDPQAFDETPA